jgi:hypothetical protein
MGKRTHSDILTAPVEYWGPARENFLSPALLDGLFCRTGRAGRRTGGVARWRCTMKIGEGPGYEPGCGSVPGTDAWARTGRVSDSPVTNRVVVRFPGPALGHGCEGKKCGASFAQWLRPCSSNSERAPIAYEQQRQRTRARWRAATVQAHSRDILYAPIALLACSEWGKFWQTLSGSW